MTYEEFVAKYKPVQNHLVEGSAFNGTMFETLGEEYDYLRELLVQGQQKRIWTYVCEGNFEMIVSGLWLVNRVGYFVTEKESENNNEFIKL